MFPFRQRLMGHFVGVAGKGLAAMAVTAVSVLAVPSQAARALGQWRGARVVLPLAGLAGGLWCCSQAAMAGQTASTTVQQDGEARKGPANQEAAREQVPEPQRRRELTQLLADCRAQQPEYAAWLLLALLDSRVVAEPAEVAKLAREVFALADRARQPFPYTLPTQLDPGISRESLWTESKEFRLDGLTLRLRALAYLEKVAPAEAKRLFLEQVFPALPPTGSCRTAIAPDLTQWYQTAARYLDFAHAQLAVSRIQSFREVQPLDGLISRLALPAAEKQLLHEQLLVAMARLMPEPRWFGIYGEETVAYLKTKGFAGTAEWEARQRGATCKDEAPELEIVFTKEELAEWSTRMMEMYDQLRRGEPLEEAANRLAEQMRERNYTGLRAATLSSALAVRFAGSPVWPQLQRELRNALTRLLAESSLDGLALTLDLVEVLRSRDAAAANSLLDLPSPQLQVLKRVWQMGSQKP